MEGDFVEEDEDAELGEDYVEDDFVVEAEEEEDMDGDEYDVKYRARHA
jgi:uncharacterized protein YcnI